jgi:tartrate dehydrogenase/decarboxylase/D-malate dehydrogenase
MVLHSPQSGSDVERRGDYLCDAIRVAEHMKRHILAVIPGDGIGPEIVPEAITTLRTVAERCGGFQIDVRQFDWGTQHYLTSGAMMPADGLDQILAAKADAILLGPVGDPRVPDHVTLWGLLLPLRQRFQQYINLRPARLLAGVRSPLVGVELAGGIDIVCVRENTEGEYAGVGGRVHLGTADEVAIQSSVFTRTGTERVIRFAFEYARAHGRAKVTSATKSNAMQHGMVFWDDVFAEVAANFPEITSERQLVDSLAARIVAKPHTLDVVVASNLFGDILTDICAAVTGSLGLAPSANLNPERRYPSLFQGVHGSAPDIAGQGVANPIAILWSTALMLEHLGEGESAAALMRAIERVLADGRIRTPDLGGTSTTREMGEAIRRAVVGTPS